MGRETGSWNPPGRGAGWRLGMLVAGLVAAGVGVLILVWPQIVTWAVASVFLLFGAFLMLSALLARGGHASPPAGVLVELADADGPDAAPDDEDGVDGP